MNTSSNHVALSCYPTGVCAWIFAITDNQGADVAKISFMGFYGRPQLKYQGFYYSILPGHLFFKIHPHSFLLGGDSIAASEPIAVANAPFDSDSDYEIKSEDIDYLLRLNGSRYELLLGDKVYGTIERVHRRTKRTHLVCDPDIPMLIQLYCLGLVLQRWRQDSYSD